jgi:hypothetical protein
MLPLSTHLFSHWSIPFKQILVLKRGVYFLNMQRSVYCSKGTGPPDENLLNAYKIKTVPSVHLPIVLKFLGFLVKKKIK